MRPGAAAFPAILPNFPADYPGWDRIIAELRAETFDSQVEKGAARGGSPADIAEQIGEYDRKDGGFEIASLQVNFNTLALDAARESVALFGREVVPRFA